MTSLAIAHPAAALERILAIAARLPAPFVVLEDGRGTGRSHLVWGARRRWRREWGEPGVVPPDILGGSSWYGVFAYESGVPTWVPARGPVVPQPFVDCFEPENRILLTHRGEVLTCDGPEAEGRWRDTSGEILCDVLAVPQPVGAPWRSFDQPSFEATVRRARECIAAGDVYQVNLAVAQCWPISGRAWDAYRRLREVNPSPWMGFADFGDWQLVCGSPELLIEVMPSGAGRSLRTRPIAGTRKKTGDPTLDARMRAELRLDEKERAEHLMLVDLARNDIGRVAEYGSVEVSEREALEEYSHVMHLVSEVRGDLWPDWTTRGVVESLFPGGTVTGCPKIRAMEIIRELEPVGRGAYTGALGWIGPGELQLNIVIRSAVVSAGQVVVQSGAGIVADSIPSHEWRETLRKGEAVRLAFGLPDGAR